MDISKISANQEEKPEQQVTSPLGETDRQWLDDHLRRIRKLITDEAIRAAKDRGVEPPEGLDVAEAAKRFAPGVRFPDEPSFPKRVLASLSGITVVSAVLAIVFWFLGWWQQGQGDASAASAAYFDIVKLFAGAVVGSTGAGVALAYRRK